MGGGAGSESAVSKVCWAQASRLRHCAADRQCAQRSDCHGQGSASKGPCPARHFVGPRPHQPPLELQPPAAWSPCSQQHLAAPVICCSARSALPLRLSSRRRDCCGCRSGDCQCRVSAARSSAGGRCRARPAPRPANYARTRLEGQHQLLRSAVVSRSRPWQGVSQRHRPCVATAVPPDPQPNAAPPSRLRSGAELSTSIASPTATVRARGGDGMLSLSAAEKQALPRCGAGAGTRRHANSMLASACLAMVCRIRLAD